MHFLRVALVTTFVAAALGGPIAVSSAEPFAAQTSVAIVDGRWHLDGQITYPGTPAEGLLINVRMVNAVFEDAKRSDFDPDANTAELIARLPDYYAHGVRALTICLQGGMPGYEGAVNSAYEPDGTLRASYLKRVDRLIEACDRQGMAVIVGCYYQRQDQALKDEDAIRRGVVETVKWLGSKQYRNAMLEIANEFPHSGFDHQILRSPEGEADLVRLAKRTNPQLLVSTSGIGDGVLAREVAEACDFLLIHFNGVAVRDIPQRIEALKKDRKPIVCNEDDKTGEAGAAAARAAVAGGASWGLMLEKHNQHYPFTFLGAQDDPIIYAELKRLTAPAATNANVFPGQQWDYRAPRQLGLRSESLHELAATVGGRGCVARNGSLAWSWGDIAKPGDIASAAKPVYVYLLLRAIESGQIARLDAAVAEFEPRLAKLNADHGFKDASITWRQLANQTSCYGVTEPPGTAFDYSDFNMALLFDVLTAKVFGKRLDQVDAELLRPELSDLLQLEDDPSLLAFGPGDRPGRMAISPRDFARFGLLYLHEGSWSGRRLLRSENARMAISTPLNNGIPRTNGVAAEMLSKQRSIGGGNDQTDHLGSYSFAWWINGVDRDGKRNWPDVPIDAYAALGHGGEHGLVVIPSLQIVMSWNDSSIQSRAAQNRAFAVLAKAAQQADASK